MMTLTIEQLKVAQDAGVPVQFYSTLIGAWENDTQGVGYCWVYVADRYRIRPGATFGGGTARKLWDAKVPLDVLAANEKWVGLCVEPPKGDKWTYRVAGTADETERAITYHDAMCAALHQAETERDEARREREAIAADLDASQRARAWMTAERDELQGVIRRIQAELNRIVSI